MSRLLQLLVSLSLTLCSLNIPAHGGGLDGYGCHHNREAGGYHCHKGQLAGQYFQSRNAMLMVLQQDTAESVSQGRKAEPSKAEVHHGEIVGVTDGDTLTLLEDNRQIKIRLAEIDIPERDQPYGTQAKKELSEMAFGKQAKAVVEDIDHYGRRVARIYVGDMDVNAEMVRRGAAWVYRQYAKDELLYDLESEARASKRGLWALPESERVPPWDWRH